MNVLALLDEELKDKNWTDDEKRRYLYLRSCEIFSYDPRYAFCRNLENGIQMQEDIRNQKIDLENVENTWSVCSSHAKYVYSRLLKELLNTTSDCVPTTAYHTNTVFKDSNQVEIVADPTEGWDYTNAKIGFSTAGYYRKDCSNTQYFNESIKEQDKRLGYLNADEYEEYFLKRKIDHLYQEFFSAKNLENKTRDSDDFLIYRMKEIKNQIDCYTNLKEFSDLAHCISDIQEKFLEYDYSSKIMPISLYQVFPDHTWEFVRIYAVELKNDMMYYALAQKNNEYSYQEITKADAISYTKNYQGRNKNLIYHS